MADDSGIGVGGDGSVAWKVWVAHVREGSIVSKAVPPAGYLQSGVGETEAGDFTIGVKVPKTGGEAFARAMQAAADEAQRYAGQPGYRVTFPLVIEPKNEDQITITWMSTPPVPPAKYGRVSSSGTMTKRRAATKKTASRKAAPKKKKPAAKKAAPRKVAGKARRKAGRNR